MKKSTLRSKTVRFAYRISFFAILLFVSQTLVAADILMGQYDFTTGADQLKASNVASGIAMGDIVVGTGTAPITSTFNGDAIETSNWSSFLNIGQGKCVNLSITKQANATEFNVSKFVVTLKRTSAAKIQINFGNEANTFDFKAYAAGALHGTSTFAPITLTENTNTGNTGVSVTSMPAVTDATPQFISIGTMYLAATSSPAEVVYIDKIEVWGTVTTTTTEVTELKNSQKITVKSTGVELIGFEGEKLNVYNLVGVKIFEINKLTNTENFYIKNKGSYIINIQGAGKSISKKILL